MPLTYLVTGAGRDIGGAIARKLAAPGSFAILHYAHSETGCRDTLDAVRSGGADGLILGADFTDVAAIQGFIAEARGAMGDRRLDVLVLNSAATAASSLGQANVAELEAMLAVNVLAPKLLMDGLHDRLSERASVIALSVAAVRQVFHPDFAAFAATKAATDVLVKGWAQALGTQGVRVNAVAPGVVEANFRADLLKDAEFRAALEGQTALGRPGRPEDIARVVAFLASDQAAWITGQVLDASGGWRL